MLKDILSKLLGHTEAPAQPAPSQPKPLSGKNADGTDLPQIGRLAQATLNVIKNGTLPMDNLDGTFQNLQPGKGDVFQTGGQWQAPLLPGLKTAPGIPYYDPLGTNDRYTNDNYLAVPINPAAIPKPMPYLQTIGGGQ